MIKGLKPTDGKARYFIVNYTRTEIYVKTKYGRKSERKIKWDDGWKSWKWCHNQLMSFSNRSGLFIIRISPNRKYLLEE